MQVIPVDLAVKQEIKKSWQKPVVQTTKGFSTPSKKVNPNTFTRRCSFCARFLCIHACSVTIKTSDHTCFYTEIFLHGDTFAQREMPFYTQILLQRDDFTLSNFTQKPKQTEVLLQRNACARRVFQLRAFSHRHTTELFPVADTRMAQRVQQAYAKSQFNYSF